MRDARELKLPTIAGHRLRRDRRVGLIVGDKIGTALPVALEFVVNCGTVEVSGVMAHISHVRRGHTILEKLVAATFDRGSCRPQLARHHSQQKREHDQRHLTDCNYRYEL